MTTIEPQPNAPEGDAVANYLKQYSLSRTDFVALLWKRKEISLDEATRLVDLYVERYPQVAEYFKKP